MKCSTRVRGSGRKKEDTGFGLTTSDACGPLPAAVMHAGSPVPVRLALALPAGDVARRVVVYGPASAGTGSVGIPAQVRGK